MLSLLKYLILVILILLQVEVFSQSQKFQNIERITITTDRILYLSGESIWFSASYSIPQDTSLILSKVLYVELFDDGGQVVESQKIGIDKGLAIGQLLIPVHANTGHYILRAYTRYQENFPSWQMTSVILSVVNPFHPLPAFSLPSVEEQVTIANMPNGNTAFRILEPLLKEVESVELYVNQLPVQAKLSYFSNGLGKFNWKITQNDQLNLLIVLKSGDTIRSSTFLPKNFPIEIISTCQSDELELSLFQPTLHDEELQVSLLNLWGHQSITKKIVLADGNAVIRFPLNKTGRGLFLVTIKDIKGDSIFQTYCHISQKKVLRKALISDSQVIAGEPISIDLSGINSNDYPLAISFVMRGTNSDNSGILPKYLIDNPLYIDGCSINSLLPDDDMADQIAIALALAREKLLDMFNEYQIYDDIVVPEINGLTLQGKLVNTDNSKPLEDELVYCSVLGNNSQFHVVRSSVDGSFVIPLNILNNAHDIYVVTKTSGKNSPKIKLNSGFCPAPPIWFPSPFIPDTSYGELITQMYMNYQINNIFNINRRQILDNKISNRPIFGNNLNQIVLDDYIQMSSTPEIFNELVPNVRVREKDGHYNMVVLDDQLNIKYDNPLILIDKVPYYNIDKLMEIQPTEIDKIEVSNHAYVYGNNLFNGVILITTNSDNFAGLPLSEGGVFVEYETLESDKQFIQFSSLVDTLEKPDFANTVYWESINYDKNLKYILIIAPANLADYELQLVSLKGEVKIIQRESVKVRKSTINN